MRKTGFTLVELMITIAILGLVASFAGPAFQQMISNNKVVAKANDLRTALAFARTEAIRRGEGITLAPIDGSNWNLGMHLGLSSQFENNRLKSGLKPLRVVESNARHFSMAVAKDRIEFNGRGFVSSPIKIDLCDNASSKLKDGRSIVVEVSGKVSVNTVKCQEDAES